MFVSVSCVIIDDIVLPDGTKYSDCLGGGGNHAAMGMRVWSDQVGLAAKIGADFPVELMEILKKTFDVRGLDVRDMHTVRSCQIFDANGSRTDVITPELKDLSPLQPDIWTFPKEYGQLNGAHFHGGAQEAMRWVPFLRKRGDPFILWEPWQRFCVPENRSQLEGILPLVDCVSPNLEEARLLLGLDDRIDLLNTFLELGARRVVIREGAQGSTYADREGRCVRVPAVNVDKVVDHTGAGNAYCGGFVVGFVVSDTIEDALCRAAVSASFALEQFGAIYPLEGIQQRAAERIEVCRAVMQKLNNQNQ